MEQGSRIFRQKTRRVGVHKRGSQANEGSFGTDLTTSPFLSMSQCAVKSVSYGDRCDWTGAFEYQAMGQKPH